MASEFTLSFDYQDVRFASATKGLLALGKQLDANFKRLPANIRSQLKDFLDTTKLAMEKRHNRTWSPRRKNPSGQAGRLNRRSGRLMKSLRVRVFPGSKTIEQVAGEIGTQSPYAGVHEYGATIRPKRSKYLAIPLPAALDSRGVPKRRGPRSWKNTFVAKSKAGNLIIFQRRRGVKGIIPLYVLKKEVTIPPRLGLGDTITRGIPVFQDRLFDKLVEQMLVSPASGGA